MAPPQAAAFICETVTVSSSKNQVPRPDEAVRTSPPQIWFMSCCSRMESPKVASSDMNMSRSATRRITT